ncbi:MAG: type II toxin-antitoxin system prevent-host-death family antitoxin [Actinobacteria bacterium]|nr:type II toxin-antitoxin system prevent-host-death family antitoxin [Actinomycetota bacterium]
MKSVNMHEAKTHPSSLVAQAINGEPFIIAKEGKPLVKVVAVDTSETAAQQRIGFLAGQVQVPADFDTMGAAEITGLFGN